MQWKVFTIYDSKSEVWGKPFYSQTTASGLRAFIDVVKDGQSEYNKFPNDFAIFEVAVWDDASGLMLPYEAKKSLGLAVEYLGVKDA
ncbi:DNA binding protein vP5 [Microviridae sp.]|nr:DNA binding protein vP5 [Microviridae sp.]